MSTCCAADMLSHITEQAGRAKLAPAVGAFISCMGTVPKARIRSHELLGTASDRRWDGTSTEQFTGFIGSGAVQALEYCVYVCMYLRTHSTCLYTHSSYGYAEI